jgi:hypothetical protein
MASGRDDIFHCVSFSFFFFFLSNTKDHRKGGEKEQDERKTEKTGELQEIESQNN